MSQNSTALNKHLKIPSPIEFEPRTLVYKEVFLLLLWGHQI